MPIQLHVQLNGFDNPTIWRRILLPSNFTFLDLHAAIQEAFDWGSFHDFLFLPTGKDHKWYIIMPECQPDTSTDATFYDPIKVTVADFVKENNLSSFLYAYDRKAQWVCKITVEKPEDNEEYPFPISLRGEGTSPGENYESAASYKESRALLTPDQLTPYDQGKVNCRFATLSSSLEDDEDDDDADDLDLDDDLDIDDEIAEFLGLNSLNKLDIGGSADEDDDDDEEDATSSFDTSSKISLAECLNLYDKQSILRAASRLGFSIDRKLRVADVRSRYAEEVLAHASSILSRLPLDDITHLNFGLFAPNTGHYVKALEDACIPPMLVQLCLADAETDDDNEEFYLHIPEELWNAFQPRLMSTLVSADNNFRYTIESFTLAVLNIYGIVPRSFLFSEMARLGYAGSTSEASDIYTELYDVSLTISSYERDPRPAKLRPSDDDTLLFSPYFSAASPEDLDKVVRKYKKTAKAPKLLSRKEFDQIAASIIRTIYNPEDLPLHKFLSKDMDFFAATVTWFCRLAWAIEMHRGYPASIIDEYTSPGQVLRDIFFSDVDLSDSNFRQALSLLDDFLNAIPHWQLRGASPSESGTLLSSEASRDFPTSD
ncbi:MAG: plasmid pRiA4b ORF-3 family protein [Bacteroidales bacterium]|nr:plasmid pRiA4b ORF-3 family protein [Bacteroidales bacterium]